MPAEQQAAGNQRDVIGIGAGGRSSARAGAAGSGRQRGVESESARQVAAQKDDTELSFNRPAMNCRRGRMVCIEARDRKDSDDEGDHCRADDADYLDPVQRPWIWSRARG